MRFPDRTRLLPALTALLVVYPAASCANSEDITNPGGTLPPIHTTTTLAASQTTIDPYFEHYKLKAGDSMGSVAKAFNVPLDVLIEYNKDRLGNNASNLPIGTEIIIPPHRWIEELPTTTTVATSDG